jgi:hypothetical protein
MLNNIIGQLIVGGLIMLAVWAIIVKILDDNARRSK